jgi:hypothetical protein
MYSIYAKESVSIFSSSVLLSVRIFIGLRYCPRRHEGIGGRGSKGTARLSLRTRWR